MENIIGLLKKLRKQNNLKKKYSSKYAFVGIGNHSINNLYPVIDYLHLDLKYIVTKSQSTSDIVSKNYPYVIATTDFDRVLADSEINGIFISANPLSHYSLVKKALTNKKNVFVEKPPCTSIEELDDLINIEKTSGQKCLVGLQKRYSRCTEILKKDMDVDDVISYNYKFIVGSYPDGDPYWDLFIHPIDLVTFIFGEAELISVIKNNSSKGQQSVFLHTKHGKITGSIEISTEYSWDMSEENMTINTKKGVYRMNNHQLLIFQPKSGTLFSMPKEKIFPSVPESKYLFNGNNFLPVLENNQIVSQGFFNEIKTFSDICEGRKVKDLSSLSSLKNTFELIFEIKNK